MSAKLEELLKAEAKAQGWKPTDMNSQLWKVISKAVPKYLNSDVKADVSGGSSSGQHSLKAT